VVSSYYVDGSSALRLECDYKIDSVDPVVDDATVVVALRRTLLEVHLY